MCRALATAVSFLFSFIRPKPEAKEEINVESSREIEIAVPNTARVKTIRNKAIKSTLSCLSSAENWNRCAFSITDVCSGPQRARINIFAVIFNQSPYHISYRLHISPHYYLKPLFKFFFGFIIAVNSTSQFCSKLENCCGKKERMENFTKKGEQRP